MADVKCTQRHCYPDVKCVMGEADAKDCPHYSNPERDAARVLELDPLADAGPWELDANGKIVNAHFEVSDNDFSDHNERWVLETRTLAPRLARAYLEQRDILLRLSGTFECGISEVEGAVVSAYEQTMEAAAAEISALMTDRATLKETIEYWYHKGQQVAEQAAKEQEAMYPLGPMGLSMALTQTKIAKCPCCGATDQPPHKWEDCVKVLKAALEAAEQRAKQAEGALDRLQYGPGSQ